jgi:hypothetical protein
MIKINDFHVSELIGNKMAIRYYNPKLKYFITTNYKVWSSTLRAQKNLVKSSKRIVLINELTARLGLNRKREHYFLVRNPYARIESFFRDKIKTHSLNVNPEKGIAWQRCQKIFFPSLGVNEYDDLESIQRQFSELSFDHFCGLLPFVFQDDRHLWPQTDAFECYVFGQDFRLTFRKVLNVEEPATGDFLDDKLGIDTQVAVNKSAGVAKDVIWTKESRQIVNQVYYDDFQKLNYEVVDS